VSYGFIVLMTVLLGIDLALRVHSTIRGKGENEALSAVLNAILLTYGVVALARFPT
jgi:hypothetical protein